ncbi:MAG: class I SAM-dependent methyltransferase [Candidatus Binataceae bacterium]
MPYPAALLDDLLARSPSRTHVLDIACGPGRICLALADRFDEVWGIDLEPEMIATARRRAADAGLSNVRWITGKAETLDAPADAFDLITIGEAFHRLDQRVVAANAFAWLKPGGLIATMGGANFFQGEQPWKMAVTVVARRYFPEDLATAAPGATTSIAEGEDLLRAAGFTGVTTTTYTQPHIWSVESIIGYLRSTSVCSQRALHSQSAVFDAELTTALFAVEPSGRFPEDLAFGCTRGRKDV